MADHNFIIHQQARQYHWSGDCFLSIKSFYHGSARYNVQHREYSVNERNYLILNDCTKYELTIDTATPTESFCVFFAPGFVCQVLSEWNSSEEQRLEHSFKKLGGIKLFERNYLHGGDVTKILQQGKRSSPQIMHEMEKEEFYYTLLNAMLSQNAVSFRETNKLALKKKSTREEIYRRIYFAKDFIDGNYTANLTLNSIAGVAMLSENHLLRNFGRLFGMSPFQYITRLKIGEAKRQIMETDSNISDVAFNLGYTSLSNFSYYFKSVTGLSPTELRKKVIHRK